jgi:hypothetical protein
MVAGGGGVKMTENKIHWSLWYVLYKQRWAALFFSEYAIRYSTSFFLSALALGRY